MIKQTNIQVVKNDKNEPICFTWVEAGESLAVPFDPQNRHCAEIMELAKTNPKIVTFDFTSLRAKAEKIYKTGALADKEL